jgi:hypothetical protein
LNAKEVVGEVYNNVEGEVKRLGTAKKERKKERKEEKRKRTASSDNVRAGAELSLHFIGFAKEKRTR